MNSPKLLILIILPIFSCHSQKTDKIEYAVYEDKEIGWTTQYSNSWKVMTAAEIEKLEGRGQTAMASTLDENLILIRKNLLWLEKDQFNSFTSNSQPFDTITDGNYKDNQEFLNQTLVNTYKSQGTQFDVKFGKVKIDGLEFSTMETTLFTPDRKKILMNQIMYDRLINGTATLTLDINYNNDKDREILLHMINSSKLLKRG